MFHSSFHIYISSKGHSKDNIIAFPTSAETPNLLHLHHADTIVSVVIDPGTVREEALTACVMPNDSCVAKSLCDNRFFAGKSDSMQTVLRKNG